MSLHWKNSFKVE